MELMYNVILWIASIVSIYHYCEWLHCNILYFLAAVLNI